MQNSYRPDNIEFQHYECELVAGIGKRAQKVQRREAMDYVAGFTVCNDFTIRDYLENYYRPNLRVKSRDSLMPLGPWLVDPEDIEDINNLQLKTRVNGELTQEGNTSDMIFDVPYLVLVQARLDEKKIEIEKSTRNALSFWRIKKVTRTTL